MATDAPRLTVIQVIPRLDSGGAERACLDMVGAVFDRGGRAIVATAGGRLTGEVKRRGGRLAILPVDSKNPLTMARNARSLERLAKESGAQILHARSRAPAWAAMRAAKAARARFLTTFHGFHSGYDKAAKRAYNSVMAKGDLVIAVSEFMGAHAREVYGAPADRVRVIPRGVDLAAFDPDAVDQGRVDWLIEDWNLMPRGEVGRPVILLPGRVSPWKGQEVFARAAALIKARRRRPDILFLIVGDADPHGEIHRELRYYVKSQGLDDMVRILPHCEDMPAAYRLADVVVSASTRPEAFGRVAVEGQAMERPVIATDHGGARETIAPGETGWLVPPDDADTLANQIEAALELSPEARAEMGRRARAWVMERYDARTMIAETLKVYDELAGL